MGCRLSQNSSPPSIEFTTVPEAGPGGAERLQAIEGRVNGAKAGQRIVLFARSGTWWVQPFATQPFTLVQRDATFRALTHIGTEYAALLVEPDYVPPATSDALPGVGKSVASVAAVGGQPRLIPRRIHFSGYEWEVGQTPGNSGGVMHANKASNVWTDNKGSLHLRISRAPDGWACAAIRLQRSLGYGSYSLQVRAQSHPEPATVLSMFTFDDAEAGQNYREIDIELSQWGDPKSRNTQFVIQPYYVPANVHRFVSPDSALTHSFHWEPGRVSFKTAERPAGKTSERLVAEHVFTSGIPTPGEESVNINLYIYGKSRTPQKNEAEVVIEKFEYLP
jgi:hypothetical protein